MNRFLLVFVGIILGELVYAQEDFESIEISCSDAPQVAIIDVTQPLSNWAGIRCTEYGHVLMTDPEWIWHAPLTNEFVRFWAQPDEDELQRIGHKAHFVKVQFEELSEDEIERPNRMLAEALGADTQPVVRAYSLRTVNSGGKSREAYFIVTEANERIGNLWGIACSQDCATVIPFMLFQPK